MRIFLLFLSTVPLVFSAYGQNSTAAPGRIVTTTRLVALFSQVESDLEKALQQNDSQTLNKLLSDDFEVWTPAPPGHPIPREDWLTNAAGHKSQSFRFHQMAVRGIADDISIVSFIFSETASGAAKNRDSFIVDVWKKAGEGWQLSDRYVSSITATGSRASTVDKRPTGKD